MLEHLDPEAVYTLEYAALHDEAESLAVTLYGHAWREAVHRTSQRWITRRFVFPRQAARFLRPVLLGVLAHDGRSTRAGRTPGWWLRDPSGLWQPVAVEQVGDLLGDLVSDDLLGQAVAAEKAARLAFEKAEEGTPARARAWLRLDEEALRVAVLSGLAGVLDTMSRNLASTLTVLRSDLRLRAEAVGDIAREWLDYAIDVEGLPVDHLGRIALSDVRDVYDRQERSGEPLLPLQTLYRALDEHVGPRHRRTHWTLPDDLQEAAV